MKDSKILGMRSLEGHSRRQDLPWEREVAKCPGRKVDLAQDAGLSEKIGVPFKQGGH